MRIIFLQEAMVAGPFLLALLIVGLVIIFLVFFIGSKILKLKEDIKVLVKGDDEKQLKEKRTQYVFLLSIILMLAIALIMMVFKLSNIRFD